MEVLVLADLYNTLGEHEGAVMVIRGGVRWLQGRKEQRYWDQCVDDREFDLLEEEGGARRGGGAGEDDEVPPGRFPLDINARHRLAVARIKMGDVEEAKVGSMSVIHVDVADLRYSSMQRSFSRKTSWITLPSLRRSRMRTLIARCMRMHARYTSSSVPMLLSVPFRASCITHIPF
jgi:general transcription factor 3C polypeptide 3 (transcription factor C subunit 4)